MTSPAVRRLRDSLIGHVRDRLDADNPIQVTIAGTPDWASRTVLVRGPDGSTSMQPFAAGFTPSAGQLATLRGESGAKVVTDRIGGRAPYDRTDADLTEVLGDHHTRDNATVGGNHDTAGGASVGNGFTVNAGGAHIEGSERVTGDRYTDGTSYGATNGGHTGNCTGTHYGDQRGNGFGDCTGTHYGDQRGNGFGTWAGPCNGTHTGDQNGNVFTSGASLVGANLTCNDVGCNHTGCGVGNFGDLSYNRLVPPPSERGLKDEDSAIEGPTALALVRALDTIRYRLREWPSAGTGIGTPVHLGPPPLQAGIYVDTVAEHAPELIIEHRNADGPTGWRTYDDRGLSTYEIAAIRELADRQDALATAVDELRAQVAALTSPTKEA